MAVLTNAESALRTALNTFAAAQATPPRIAWPNEDFEEVTGETYLEPRFLPNTGERFIGENPLKRQMGLFTIMVWSPAIDPAWAGPLMADALMAYFDRDTNPYFTSGGVTVQMGSPIPGQASLPSRSSAIVEGDWSTIPVTVRWWADVQPS